MSTACAARARLCVGEPAPLFSLRAHPSGRVDLADYAGQRNVLLAFYPRDDSPVCIQEMCALSDNLDRFNSAGTHVFGVSRDSLASHETFADKYGLNLPLLSDEDGEVARAYGALRGARGHCERVLFVIDRGGLVRHVHEGMPSVADLLTAVRRLN
ncbi:MAG TPA: peroxiredoxin [Gemmataceae bacterium]|jgi:peroxiredoxin Q/BCP|nr:peroxiredoxin [Gemmataceae bacterium]